jgi:poly-gamma-glutamate synthesis protein (capsule biosynthesis protein)
VADADLAMCNVETTFAGTHYTGYPAFSTPDSLASDIKAAGFDVAITSNNHMADRGYDGVIRTQEILAAEGFAVVGSVMEPEDPRYIIEDVQGIKVGIVAYTYETGSGYGTTSLNGAYISDDTASVINSFNFNTLDEDCERIRGDIDAAKAAGAEVIVVYYHWGEEYQLEPNQWQEELAQRTADMGADMIFASHPHVPQKTDWVTVTDSEKKVPVFYSLGNYVSNQRAEYMNNRYTEEGIMGIVTLTYKEGTGITDIAMEAVPLWVDKYTDSGKTVYTVIPLDENMESNESLQTSGHMSKAQQALEDINGILGSDTE